ncbi:hypothetical protein BVC93_13100 [Mycobacterium sp. MS1601]|nr:hypothetical protein BVC93_13100 [Mycobacterium sp. MS1601]
MKTIQIAAIAFVFAATSAVVNAHAEPSCPDGYTPDSGGCVARLTAVSADSAEGTLTGTPIGGATPVTIFGEQRFYLPSAGFGSAPPDLVAQWDAAIAGAGPGAPSDPNWYGEGKAAAFLPRQLNDLAARLPPGTIVVRGEPDPTDSHLFELQSIQPVA